MKAGLLSRPVYVSPCFAILSGFLLPAERNCRIAYIHLRNVIGKAPHYRETFIDEGDVDMIRVLSILKRNAFKGVIIPDHTPQMSCAALWHAGMTHNLGFVPAVLAMLESSSTQQDEREVYADWWLQFIFEPRQAPRVDLRDAGSGGGLFF